MHGVCVLIGESKTINYFEKKIIYTVCFSVQNLFWSWASFWSMFPFKFVYPLGSPTNCKMFSICCTRHGLTSYLMFVCLSELGSSRAINPLVQSVSILRP